MPASRSIWSHLSLYWGSQERIGSRAFSVLQEQQQPRTESLPSSGWSIVQERLEVCEEDLRRWMLAEEMNRWLQVNGDFISTFIVKCVSELDDYQSKLALTGYPLPYSAPMDFRESLLENITQISAVCSPGLSSLFWTNIHASKGKSAMYCDACWDLCVMDTNNKGHQSTQITLQTQSEVSWAHAIIWWSYDTKVLWAAVPDKQVTWRHMFYFMQPIWNWYNNTILWKNIIISIRLQRLWLEQTQWNWLL